MGQRDRAEGPEKLAQKLQMSFFATVKVENRLVGDRVEALNVGLAKK